MSELVAGHWLVWTLNTEQAKMLNLQMDVEDFAGEVRSFAIPNVSLVSFLTESFCFFFTSPQSIELSGTL